MGWVEDRRIRANTPNLALPLFLLTYWKCCNRNPFGIFLQFKAVSMRKEEISKVNKRKLSQTQTIRMKYLLLLCGLWSVSVESFVPLIDGGKEMPKLYDGWFNEQISKQAASAVSRAVAAGKKKIEVNFPPVPNVEGSSCKLKRII